MIIDDRCFISHLPKLLNLSFKYFIIIFYHILSYLICLLIEFQLNRKEMSQTKYLIWSIGNNFSIFFDQPLTIVVDLCNFNYQITCWTGIFPVNSVFYQFTLKTLKLLIKTKNNNCLLKSEREWKKEGRWIYLIC